MFQAASDAALEDPATEAALADYLARIARAQQWSGTPPGGVVDGVGRRDRACRRRSRSPRSPSAIIEVVPIDDALIASEQDMADAFAEAGLLPEQIDLSDVLHHEVQPGRRGGGAA